jgi:cytochrome b6-f complex iron-sulfur subunit
VTLVVAGVLGVVLLAAVFALATARNRPSTGRLSRETVRSDRSAPPGDGSARTGLEHGARSQVADPEADPRARAHAIAEREVGDRPGDLVRSPAEVVRYEPVSEDELGVTRRQFFNRGILTAVALGVGAFGAASVAFVWPTGGGGFGGKTNIGSVSDVQKALAGKLPYYNAAAKTYIQPYPKAALPKAAKVYPAVVLAGMELGYVALYQKCPHLGCRVPWCTTSQWFECPCHGSKYNRVGEKKGGPAPRGMDRFAFAITGGSIVVDTGTVIQGPPIGTDTTGQGAEGPPCVG